MGRSLAGRGRGSTHRNRATEPSRQNGSRGDSSRSDGTIVFRSLTARSNLVELTDSQLGGSHSKDQSMGWCRPLAVKVLVLAIAFAAGLGGIVRAGEGDQAKRASKPFTAGQVRFFAEKVQPILEERCLKCHGR